MFSSTPWTDASAAKTVWDKHWDNLQDNILRPALTVVYFACPYDGIICAVQKV